MLQRWMDGSPATRLGKPIEIQTDYHNIPVTIIPIMEIRAPRGKALIYKSKPYNLDIQCRAVRAFMEQHSHD